MKKVVQKSADPVVKETILARLEILSRNLHFSSGDQAANISRDEMIQHVTNESTIGLDYIETEMEFLRALRTGIVAKIANPNLVTQ